MSHFPYFAGIYEAPWVSRVADMHSSAARDLDAEQKVVRLSEDVKDLAREIRAKDQTIQEASVKIELLEKRTEAVKRQADALAEMEGEVVKAREQERELERTVEQLQRDYDVMAAENAKLKLAIPAEKAAGSGLDAGEYTTFTGSLEVSHLVQQVCIWFECRRTLGPHLMVHFILKQIETLGNAVRFFAGRMPSSARRNSSRSSTSSPRTRASCRAGAGRKATPLGSSGRRLPLSIERSPPCPRGLEWSTSTLSIRRRRGSRQRGSPPPSWLPKGHSFSH